MLMLASNQRVISMWFLWRVGYFGWKYAHIWDDWNLETMQLLDSFWVSHSNFIFLSISLSTNRSTTKCLQTIIFVCLKRRPYYIISYNKLVISQENHVGALVSFGHESIRWPRCRSEQVTLVLWCFFRGDEILPSYITPWKTNERPLKINGCFRCISYWNSPLFRGTC